MIGAPARARRCCSRAGIATAIRQARWLLTLALYDLVFGLIAYAVFDFLLED